MGIIKEENWTGNAEALAKLVKFWLRKKDIGDKSFEPNERLVRDYVAKNILSRPERLGKEAIYGFKQLIQFIACRAMIEDGWPLSKISEDFQISSINEIVNLIPGESIENDSLSLISEYKSENRRPSLDRDLIQKSSLNMDASSSAPNQNYSASFIKRNRDNYETKTDISEILKRLGSDFGNVIKEDFTAYQLASWLILLMDKDKAKEITRKQAEDIGRAITAALLNQNSLTKNDRDIYTQQIRELSSLEDEISNLNFEKQKIREDHEKLILELNSTKKIYLKQLEELKSEVKLMQETKDKMKRD
tara:strand:+ start:217 stop:1131 length:915 start_codon:yes stop_codon:yes gene_type:complete